MQNIGGLKYVNQGFSSTKAQMIKQRLVNGITEANAFNVHKLSMGNKTSLPGVRDKFSYERAAKNNFYYREPGAQTLGVRTRAQQQDFIKATAADVAAASTERSGASPAWHRRPRFSTFTHSAELYEPANRATDDGVTIGNNTLEYLDNPSTSAVSKHQAAYNRTAFSDARTLVSTNVHNVGKNSASGGEEDTTMNEGTFAEPTNYTAQTQRQVVSFQTTPFPCSAIPGRRREHERRPELNEAAHKLLSAECSRRNRGGGRASSERRAAFVPPTLGRGHMTTNAAQAAASNIMAALQGQ